MLTKKVYSSSVIVFGKVWKSDEFEGEGNESLATVREHVPDQ
jgi:hypothetical protein